MSVPLVIVAPLIVVAVAAHSTGVTRVGLLANTKDPLPVSSLITPFNSSEVVAANCASVHDVRASPPPAGLDHFRPVTSAESAVRTCQLVPTASRDAVFAPVPPARSPFASQIASVATDPPPEYCGIFRVEPTSVDAQLVQVVVSVKSHCFPSNCVWIALVTQSV